MKLWKIYFFPVSLFCYVHLNSFNLIEFLKESATPYECTEWKLRRIIPFLLIFSVREYCESFIHRIERLSQEQKNKLHHQMQLSFKKFAGIENKTRRNLRYIIEDLFIESESVQCKIKFHEKLKIHAFYQKANRAE